MNSEIRKLLEDIASHLKKHDGFKMDPEVDYPGYPDPREREAQNLYYRIQRELEGKDK